MKNKVSKLSSGKIKALFVGVLFYGAGLILEFAGPVNLPMIYGGLV